MVETLGGWSNEAARTISNIGRLLGQRSGTDPAISTRHLFQRLAIGLWKGNATLWVRRLTVLFLPRARMREVSQSVVCLSGGKKMKSRHIDPHKPSKWSQTIANSKKLLYMYLTEVKALRFAVFRLIPTFHNYL